MTVTVFIYFVQYGCEVNPSYGNNESVFLLTRLLPYTWTNCINYLYRRRFVIRIVIGCQDDCPLHRAGKPALGIY